MRLYIAGPMSHYPNHNRHTFKQAAKTLSESHFDVFDPAPFEQDGWTQAQYIRWALGKMLTCDGVATLPNWQESWGASIEVRTAHSVLMPVMPFMRWVHARHQEGE